MGVWGGPERAGLDREVGTSHLFGGTSIYALGGYLCFDNYTYEKLGIALRSRLAGIAIGLVQAG